MLNSYLQQVQRLLGDQNQQLFNIFDLKGFINEARQRIAAECQCVRILPPSSGSILSIIVTNPGSGYTSEPTITISGPDAIGGGIQATAVASFEYLFTTTINTPFVFTTTINTPFVFTPQMLIELTNPGTGYVAVPTVTISGGGGAGATAIAVLSPHLVTTVGQEVYKFADVDAIIQATNPGVQGVIAVQSVAVSWGTTKPVLRHFPWSNFQAYLRSTNIGNQNYPAIWAQYAQGYNGSIYVWPLPSIVAQMEWDCYCLPVELVDDSTYEALPYPWTSAVPYYACYIAYITVQKRDDSNYMLSEYKRKLAEYRMFVETAVVPDFYDWGQ